MLKQPKPHVAVLAFLALAAAPAPKAITPADIVAASPAGAWRTIDPRDVVVMQLKNGARVIIQLAPEFAPVHVANIRALARAHWWDRATIYRVQDNYVVQWGRNDSKEPLPSGVVAQPPAEYARPLKERLVRPLGYPDDYAPSAGFVDGWPMAYDPKSGIANLVHCYGFVGAGRDLSPDTGTGGELYAVIGQAPRHLDRNIALIGRIVEGADNLSSLPRGTGDLGFYKNPTHNVPIASIRLASDMPPGEQPSFQYMDTSSATFGAYVHARANRKDAFFIRPAGGVDLCNVPVPVRRTPVR